MNVELREIATLAQRLLRPDQVTLDETERDHARHRVEDAVHAGSLDDERAKTALIHVANARTRGDLRRAMPVVPGGAAPSGLVNALRGVSVLWLGRNSAAIRHLDHRRRGGVTLTRTVRGTTGWSRAEVR
jgi:hypothetical protein